MRGWLERLADLADSEGLAVLALHHTGKAFRYGAAQLARAAPETAAAHALSGSREWTGTPRAALAMYGHGEDGAEVLAVKANAGEVGCAVRLRKHLTSHGSAGGKYTIMRGWERAARLTPSDRRAGEPPEANGGGGPFKPGEVA